MDANNLATVFGPNILKSQNPDPLISLGDSALTSYVVSLMIAQADYIFKMEYNKQGNRVCGGERKSIGTATATKRRTTKRRRTTTTKLNNNNNKYQARQTISNHEIEKNSLPYIRIGI